MAKARKRPLGITALTVSGYKSIRDECRIEIRPLTILAGANSSGKSSAMQPLLLLKQTLEASYDPGPLLLDGPNVRLTSSSQLLSRLAGGPAAERFSVGIESERHGELTLTFATKPRSGLVVDEMVQVVPDGLVSLRLGMSHDQIDRVLPKRLSRFFRELSRDEELVVRRERCFLRVLLESSAGRSSGFRSSVSLGAFSLGVEGELRRVVHLPGLRGIPARMYMTTAVGPLFPGTFENYVASVVYDWQRSKSPMLKKLGESLETLGLTWKIAAKPIDETQVELRVGRLPHGARGGARDLVSIADVGFGVSQALPALVALLKAQPGELVYIEQPELHLHPRAQTALAHVLADAARRGVKVVAETHSPLLLLGVQSLVAEKELSPDLVILHWFERQKDGSSKVTSAELDRAGAFGDWPQDFGEVELSAESRYLDAAEQVGGGE